MQNATHHYVRCKITNDEQYETFARQESRLSILQNVKLLLAITFKPDIYFFVSSSESFSLEIYKYVCKVTFDYIVFQFIFNDIVNSVFIQCRC